MKGKSIRLSTICASVAAVLAMLCTSFVAQPASADPPHPRPAGTNMVIKASEGNTLSGHEFKFYRLGEYYDIESDTANNDDTVKSVAVKPVGAPDVQPGSPLPAFPSETWIHSAIPDLDDLVTQPGQPTPQGNGDDAWYVMALARLGAPGPVSPRPNWTQAELEEHMAEYAQQLNGDANKPATPDQTENPTGTTLELTMPQGLYLVTDSAGFPIILGTKIDNPNSSPADKEEDLTQSAPCQPTTPGNPNSLCQTQTLGTLGEIIVKPRATGLEHFVDADQDESQGTGSTVVFDTIFDMPTTTTVSAAKLTVSYPKYEHIDASTMALVDDPDDVPADNPTDAATSTHKIGHALPSSTFNPSDIDLTPAGSGAPPSEDDVIVIDLTPYKAALGSKKLDLRVRGKAENDMADTSKGENSTDSVSHANLHVDYYSSSLPGGIDPYDEDKEVHVHSSSLKLRKVDFEHTSDMLEGAKFKISTEDEDPVTHASIEPNTDRTLDQFDGNSDHPADFKSIPDEETTDSHGIIDWTGMGRGKYLIEETQAAPGHTRPLPVSFHIEVNRLGAVTFTNGESENLITNEDEDDSVPAPETVTVRNISSLAQLPQTGSKYLTIIAAAVVVLAIAGLMVLLVRRKA